MIIIPSMLLSFIISSILSSHYPTILVHGIGGDANDLIDLNTALSDHNIDVYSLQIGNGKLDSIVWNINKQCASLNSSIANLNLDAERINILGVSQGGLLARCYVEKYAHINKQVNSLITYGSPHMGIYTPLVSLPWLEYWKDPYHYEDYLQTNDFLVYINNEKEHENMELYKSNLLSLNHFLIVWSHIDKVIFPVESSKFEFYNISLAEERKELEIAKLNETKEYLNDMLGLRELHKNKKLDIVEYPCKHEQFKHSDCFWHYFPGIENTLMNISLELM